MSANRPDRPVLDLREVPTQAFLAVAALLTAGIELASWSQGDAPAGVTAIVLVAMAVPFAWAAWLRERGHEREAAVIGAAALMAAVVIFALLYPGTELLVMVPPIAFVMALPYLHGRGLAAFVVLAIVAAVVIGSEPSLPGVEGIGTVITAIGSAFGTIVVTGLLLQLTWHAYRSAETERARYAQLVADLPVGVVRIAPDDTFAEVNEAFVAMLRYPSADALRGQPIASIFADPDEDPWERAEPDADGMRTGQVRVRRHDGTKAWIRFRTRPASGAAGTVRWYDSAVEDVTAERSEREAQSRLAAVVDSAPDAIFAMALDGTFLSWNGGAERVYGYTAEEMIGRKVFDVVRPAYAILFREVLDTIAAGGVVPPFDLEQVRKDGNVVTVALGLAPVRDADGKPVASTVIGRDITEQRRLLAQQEELEAQLLQAQKMEAVGRLAGGIAHDFNNLLTAITGFGGLVASELRGRQLEDQLQVLRAAERAGDLTRRLLAFARSSPTDPRPVAIDAVLEDAHRMVRRLVPERIEVELALGADRHVVADPVEIEQVILNLVVNAVDATPGAGRIRIATEAVELGPEFVEHHLGSIPGPHVLLTVSDTGTGMDEAVLARIFDPFFTTKERGEGTGLGLSTVFAIVRRSGGTVWVDSTPGSGTTFRIYLPQTEAAIEMPTVGAGEAPTGQETLLLVEDEEAVRALAERILVRAGYTVHAAANPAEAATIIASTRVDGVVSDVIMPGMSGPEFVAGLPADLPVVFMSGYVGGGGADLHLERPTRTLVAKPFEPATLAHAVRAVLDADTRPTPRPPGRAQ